MNELKMTVQEMLEFHKLLERKLGRINQAPRLNLLKNK